MRGRRGPEVQCFQTYSSLFFSPECPEPGPVQRPASYAGRVALCCHWEIEGGGESHTAHTSVRAQAAHLNPQTPMVGASTQLEWRVSPWRGISTGGPGGSPLQQQKWRGDRKCVWAKGSPLCLGHKEIRGGEDERGVSL